MGPGGIAVIILSVAVVIIAIALAYAIFKVGRLVDEVQESVRSVNKLTHTAEEMTAKLSNSINGLFEKNSSLLKLLTGVATTVMSRKRGSKEHE